MTAPTRSPGQDEPSDPARVTDNAAEPSSLAPPTANRPLLPSPTSEIGLSLPAKLLNAAPSLAVRSASPSAAPSPLSSRDTSPVRLMQRPQPQQHQQLQQHTIPGAQRPRGALSRKNSQDTSPNRPSALPTPTATIPSAAAIQRALSSSNTPQLQPTAGQDASSRVPRPQKSPASTNSGEGTPHWPISPRLRSPPPSVAGGTRSRRNSSRSQTRKPVDGNTTTSAGTGSNPTANLSARLGVRGEMNSDSDDQAPLTMKNSSRGVSGAGPTLETVQEASLPATPAFEGVRNAPSDVPSEKVLDDDRSSLTVAKVSEDLSTRIQTTESGSESGGNRSEGKNRTQDSRMPAAQKQRAMPSRPSFTSIGAGKQKAVSETGKNNMTVETETVSSIAQPAISGPTERSGPGRADPAGSVRLKPSTETIRPRKERKKVARKAPSIASGTASSKADIFEAKVASAVDEANSSDSEETFVYESNPPDAQPHRSRHHSRTPSATSMASLVDHRNTARAMGNMLAGKRSMKFASNPYNNSPVDAEAPERSDGTARAGHLRLKGGSGVHYHHIGRHGRGGFHPASFFDNSDSPYSGGSTFRSTQGRRSRPASPGLPNRNLRLGNGSNGRKSAEMSQYDMDVEGVADDERTPLVGSVRSSRGSRVPRRPNSASLRQLEHYQRRRRNWLARFAGCIVMTIMLLLLVFGAVGFLFATTKPLYNVNIREIQNVLASEQEIMLDLLVGAINPNVIAVTVQDLDVNLFAKSKHVGTDKWWRDHHRLLDSNEDIISVAGNVDHGTDPIEDPEGDSQTMLLGRIFQFDSALNFEGSPIKHHMHYSVGEVRLAKPGNKTEAGGTERWERVIQYPFELIVRGVLKYQLPLSSRTHTAAISASILVNPEHDGVTKGGQQQDGSPTVPSEPMATIFSPFSAASASSASSFFSSRILRLIDSG